MNEEKIKQTLLECGIGKIFIDAKLSDFSIQMQSEITDNFFLYGPVGCGKTHFLSAIIREYIIYSKEKPLLPMKYIIHDGKRKKPVFITISEFLFKLRNAYGDNSIHENTIVNNLINCPVLCLDDLGNTKVTDWSIQMLDMIFNGRYNNHKELRTYITSNLNLNEIENTFGQRIASRINGMCDIVNFDGIDRRLVKK